jgi:nickel-dependent lactate racemase
VRSKKTIIRLPYGTSFVEAEVPANNLSCVLERQETQVLADDVEAIRHALNFSIHSLSLRERLDSHDKVVVLATDNTRACPDEKLLPVILKEIEYEVPRRNISVIVALGLHAPLNKDALTQKLGKAILENYQVKNHDSEQTVQIGTTSRGTPVEINKEVIEADFIISTGFIEPHFFAGFSGGRKSIAPGVSSPSAIRKNHSYEMISHKNARAGILEGNPVHEDLVEQAKLAGLNFIVNVLLDHQGQITHVVAGDAMAHERDVN